MKHEQHADAIAAGAKCEECPLYGCGRGPVPAKRVRNPKLVIVGEAPGHHEVSQGAPFVGKSGEELKAGLKLGGLTLDECNITNVLMCQPPDDFKEYLRVLGKKGKTSPVDCCAPRLAREIEKTRPKVVLAIGAQALQWFARYLGIPYGKGEEDVGDLRIHSILNQHGAPVEIPKERSKAGIEIIYSALHPAFAMRSAREYKYVIRNDIGRAAAGALRGYVVSIPYEKHQWVDRTKTADEAIREIEALTERAMQAKSVTCDIETDTIPAYKADIRCVGFAFQEGAHEVAFVVPFKWRNGNHYWVHKEHLDRARACVTRLLSNKTAVYHNGMFDTSVLLKHGLIPEEHRMRPWKDSLLMDLNTPACDLPRSLGAMTRRRFETRMWKEDADAKDASGIASDLALHAYNMDDCIWTMRCAQQLKHEIVAYDSKVASSIDHKLAPIYREAGDLGVWTNERVRAELSVTIRKILKERREDFLRTSGLPEKFNLRSPQQVAKWLYEDLGLIPTLNSTGKEYKPGDTPSTGIPAVLTILDSGVDDRTEKALNAFLHYKSAEKLRGSYIENSHTVEYPDDFRGLYDQPPLIIEGEEIFPARPLLAHMRIQWRLGGTPSGRTSATPGIQTIPSKAYGGLNLKVLFQAPPGHCIVGADLEQVEGRIYAAESGDQVLLKAIKQGLDMHSLNAAMLFTEIPDPDHPKVMEQYHHIRGLPKADREKLRGVAKTVLYGETYGASGQKLYEIFRTARNKATLERLFENVSREDAMKWHEAWHKTHPETRRWQAECRAFFRKHGYVVSRIHRRKRWFPGGPNKQDAVTNFFIQATSGDIKNNAVLAIVDAIPFRKWSKYSGFILDVHDDLKVCVPIDKAQYAIKVIDEVFRWEFRGIEFPPDKPLATWDLAAQ